MGAGLLAALAVGGWVFIGFDACVGSSEETRGAARRVPRAVWLVVLSVAALVLLNALASVLAHPDPGAVVRGEDVDPVTTAVVNSFGSWSTKPFAALVLVAFISCGIAAQGLTARTMYSIARDDVLPGAAFLRRVDRRGTPVGGVIVTAVLALCRTAARAELGGDRQHPDLRHRGDLLRLPAHRAGGARGSARGGPGSPERTSSSDAPAC